jgi:hypothetical protein
MDVFEGSERSFAEYGVSLRLRGKLQFMGVGGGGGGGGQLMNAVKLYGVQVRSTEYLLQ